MKRTSSIQSRASNDFNWLDCSAGCAALLFVVSINATGAVVTSGPDSTRVDSLWSVVNKSSGKEELNAILELIYEYTDYDNAKALVLAKQARELAATLGDGVDLAMTTRIEGQLLRRVGKNSEGIVSLREALSIAERYRINDEQLMTSNALALAYVLAGRYDSALRLYYGALRIPMDKGQEKWRAIVLSGIGLLYYKLGENNESISFSRRAFEIAEPLSEYSIMMSSLSNITLCHIKLGNYDEAEKLLADWNVRFADKAESRHLRNWEFNRGLRLLKIAQYTPAIEYFQRSLQLAREAGDGFLELENVSGIARCHAGLGNYIEANRLLAWCEEKAIASGFDTSLLIVYQTLIGINEAKKNTHLLSVVQANYIKVKDRILNENVLHRISIARVEFEEEENTKFITKQAEVIALNERVIERQRWLNAAVVTLAVVLGAFVVLLIRFVKYQKKVARDLDRKVFERTRELQGSEDALVKSLGEQRAMMDLISRKVRASMATFRGLWHLATIESQNPTAVTEKFENAASELLQVSFIIDKDGDLRREEGKPVQHGATDPRLDLVQ